MPTVQANGIGIYYESQGSGRPLLLIGGLGSDITLLHGLIGGLAGGHRVIAFDNRGAGRSGKPDVPYTVEMMAADAACLLDALSVERADVVGISMGGKIALELALSDPGRVDHLVLIGASARARSGKVTMSWPMRLAGLLSLAGLLRGKYPQPDYAHQRQRAASGSYDAVGRLSQIGVPTLIAHGRKDRSVPFERAEQLHRGIPGSELAAFRGGHLFFLLSERAALTDRIERFLGAR